MSKLKPLLTLSALMLLTACASAPKLSVMPSNAPTQNLAPTISCAQHVPDATLPDFPLPKSGDMLAYVNDLTDWGTKAAGAFQSEKVLRHNTANCLDALESKGLIIQGN